MSSHDAGRPGLVSLGGGGKSMRNVQAGTRESAERVQEAVKSALANRAVQPAVTLQSLVSELSAQVHSLLRAKKLSPVEWSKLDELILGVAMTREAFTKKPPTAPEFVQMHSVFVDRFQKLYPDGELYLPPGKLSRPLAGFGNNIDHVNPMLLINLAHFEPLTAPTEDQTQELLKNCRMDPFWNSTSGFINNASSAHGGRMVRANMYLERFASDTLYAGRGTLADGRDPDEYQRAMAVYQVLNVALMLATDATISTHHKECWELMQRQPGRTLEPWVRVLNQGTVVLGGSHRDFGFFGAGVAKMDAMQLTDFVRGLLLWLWGLWFANAHDQFLFFAMGKACQGGYNTYWLAQAYAAASKKRHPTTFVDDAVGSFAVCILFLYYSVFLFSGVHVLSPSCHVKYHRAHTFRTVHALLFSFQKYADICDFLRRSLKKHSVVVSPKDDNDLCLLWSALSRVGQERGREVSVQNWLDSAPHSIRLLIEKQNATSAQAKAGQFTPPASPDISASGVEMDVSSNDCASNASFPISSSPSALVLATANSPPPSAPVMRVLPQWMMPPLAPPTSSSATSASRRSSRELSKRKLLGDDDEWTEGEQSRTRALPPRQSKKVCRPVPS
jgi:hypothetical protein